MIDGISPTVAHGVFGSLRNELWALEGAAWVVAGDTAAEAALPGAAGRRVLRADRRDSPRSTRADAAKLLRAHLPGSDRRADRQERLEAEHSGNPRRLLRAAADIQAGISPTASATDALAQRAEQAAGPLAGRLVSYLADNGPACASDQRLLRQVGASRQRASQLMHQLESAGLLETLEVREPGRRGPARTPLRRENPVSNQVLNRLLDVHAFDGSPLHVDLPAFHVPFDDRGRHGCESGVVRAARSTERIGLQGPIGCGKTSVLRYALDDPDTEIAPIWVSVAFDDDEVVLDVRRFAAHLIQSVVRDAQRAGTLDLARSRRDPQRLRRPAPAARHRAPAGVPARGAVLGGERRTLERGDRHARRRRPRSGPPARCWRPSTGRSRPSPRPTASRSSSSTTPTASPGDWAARGHATS